MEKQHAHKAPNHYRILLITTGISFVCMYALMYSMVDTWSNVLMNFNQFYMAMVMTAPMPVIMIVFMQSMYPRKKLNALIIATSLICFAVFFTFIRKQTAVDDEQFLKGMIPHHAAAIQMVEHAKLEDTAVQRLARDIIGAQQKEIEFMKQKLKEMKR